VPATGVVSGSATYPGRVSTQARIFAARLSDTGVFDPNGDPVGRVRDVVVLMRGPVRPPRVVGLVVEMPRHRRVFLSITRVLSIDAGSVVSTGQLNLARFESRPGELLVLADLLDRQVTVRATGAAAVVYDIGIDQERTRDWVVSKIAVRTPTTRLHRRSESTILDWDAVTGLAMADSRQGTGALLGTLDGLHAADLAHALSELSAKRRTEVAAALDDERLADVMEELPEEDQVEILAQLGSARAADVLEAMDPDDAADLIAELPPETAEQLLTLMEPDEADDVRRLLVYAEGTAGSLMTTEPIILPPDATVADALARARTAEISPALAATTYIARPPTDTPTGRFLGYAHLQRLLREPPSTLVSAVLDTELETLRPNASVEDVTRFLATYNLVAAAVVDTDGRLLGAVTVDDVLDSLLPDDWRSSRVQAEPAEPARRASVQPTDPRTDSAPGVTVPGDRPAAELGGVGAGVPRRARTGARSAG